MCPRHLSKPRRHTWCVLGRMLGPYSSFTEAQLLLEMPLKNSPSAPESRRTQHGRHGNTERKNSCCTRWPGVSKQERISDEISSKGWCPSGVCTSKRRPAKGRGGDTHDDDANPKIRATCTQHCCSGATTRDETPRAHISERKKQPDSGATHHPGGCTLTLRATTLVDIRRLSFPTTEKIYQVRSSRDVIGSTIPRARGYISHPMSYEP